MPPVDITSLLPALTTAGGALAGVLLTLAITSVLSARQRRHERQGRAFDVRLQVYADYLHDVEAFARVRQELEEANDLLRKVIEMRKAVRALKNELAAATERVNKGGSPADVEALAAEKRNAEAELELGRRSIDRNDEKLEKARGAGEQYLNKIYLLRSRIEVLCDLPTLEATAAIMENLARDEAPTVGHRMEFRDAVRRELGLDRRCWPARVKSWARRQIPYWRKKIAKWRCE